MLFMQYHDPYCKYFNMLTKFVLKIVGGIIPKTCIIITKFFNSMKSNITLTYQNRRRSDK